MFFCCWFRRSHIKSETRFVNHLSILSRIRSQISVLRCKLSHFFVNRDSERIVLDSGWCSVSVLSRRDANVSTGGHTVQGFSNFYLESHRICLLISSGNSTSPQNRQLIVYYFQLKKSIDGLVGE